MRRWNRLTIKKHYASETQKQKDKAKEYSGTKAFVYSFKLIDLKSKLYVAFGMSLKSEKEAFDKSMEMLKHIDVKIDSVRLDKYYSFLLMWIDSGKQRSMSFREKMLH
jgi:transposase